MIYINNAQSVGKRKNQEDYFASRSFKDGYICVVADGMGGLEGGEIASSLSVKTFMEFIKEHQQMFDDKDLFTRGLRASNEALTAYKKKHKQLDGMGTTFVALLVYEDKIFWLSVGDSVLYRYRNGILERLNENHSIAGQLQEKLTLNEITQEDYDKNPNKHMITSALMGEEIEYIDLPKRFLKTKDGDLYIVASDGIHALSDENLKDIVKNTKTQNLAEKILYKVQKQNRKNQDNTTLIIAKIQKDMQTKELMFSKKYIFIIIFIILCIIALYFKI